MTDFKSGDELFIILLIYLIKKSRTGI